MLSLWRRYIREESALICSTQLAAEAELTSFNRIGGTMKIQKKGEEMERKGGVNCIPTERYRLFARFSFRNPTFGIMI